MSQTYDVTRHRRAHSLAFAACVWTMSQFLAKVEAIRKALGLRPAEELPAPLAISEAMVLMGIKANETWALPERVEALVEALDLRAGRGRGRAA